MEISFAQFSPESIFYPVRDRLPITSIRESYETPRGRGSAVLLPLLIGTILAAMALFYLHFWQGKEEKATAAGSDAQMTATSMVSSTAGPSTVKPSDPSDAIASAAIEPEPLVAPDSPPPPLPAVTEADFTPWMSSLSLRTYILQKNYGHNEDFWQRGHWMRAVEGRWRGGDAEFRIAIGTMKHRDEFQWQHAMNLSESEFYKEDAHYRQQGYRLIQSQIWQMPNGSTRHQAVWRRESGVHTDQVPSPLSETNR